MVRPAPERLETLDWPRRQTQVTATSVLLPDVVVHPIADWPLAEGAPQRFTQPPMIVIEILSLGDSMVEMEEKCDAYEAMGIPNI